MLYETLKQSIMKNLFIFTRCFWYNLVTRFSLLFLSLFGVLTHFGFTKTGLLFLLLFLIFIVYSHFGNRAYKAYKNSKRQLENGYILDPISYNEFTGLNLARLDFQKENPNTEIRIITIRGFKKQQPIVMY